MMQPPFSELFQSTRPMRGATRINKHDFSVKIVSIHAPHAGRDVAALGYSDNWDVSIHAPHAGRDSATSYSGR